VIPAQRAADRQSPIHGNCQLVLPFVALRFLHLTS
jgi:hypothetical protein